MRRLFLLTLFCLLMLPSLYAQPDSATHIFLHLQGGVGYGLYRDLGASPLTYQGLQLHPEVSLCIQKPDWRYEAYLSASGGAYGLKLGTGYIQAYGGHPVVSFRVWRKLETGSPIRLWLGGSVDDLFDIRYNSSLGNANMAFGNFARLNLEGCAEYRLCSWLFHAKLQLNALALVMRPGFSYMDNFDQEISNPSVNVFDQYHTYLTPATCVATDLGATLVLGNGNRIGLSYQWGYLTSHSSVDGVTAPHLFQCADHALLVHLGFILK